MRNMGSELEEHQEGLSLVNDEQQNVIAAMREENENLELEIKEMQGKLEYYEEQLGLVHQDKEQLLLRQKQDFKNTLEVAKQEVKRKYTDELKVLKESIMEMKHRFIEEMVNKENQVKSLHYQH